MKRSITALFCASLVFCALGNGFTADFGAVLGGEFSAGGNGDASAAGNITLAPWLSLPVGDGGLYLSAGITADFSDKAVAVPELLRLEFSYPFGPLALRAGRISWQDPTAFTAKGFFDGADISLDFDLVSLGAAALYTGLLYKGTADINISPGDSRDYSAAFDWGDSSTYAAPRRFLAALYGNFPGLPWRRGNLFAGILAQFDLSDADEPFHTQYLLLRHTLDYKMFDLDIAGAVELENTDEDGLGAAFAVSAEGGVQLPAPFKNRLSLGMRWASGDGPQTAAFFPVVMEAQGLIFKPFFSGIMVIRTGFEARVLPSLSAALGLHYFLRTDSVTIADPDIDGDTESYALGLETSGSLLWAPFSDLSFSLEGGVFFPQTGAAMHSDAPVRWLLTLGVIFSF